MTLFRPEHEGGDTWAKLVLRAAEAFHEIGDRHHGQTVVIATHNETVQASSSASVTCRSGIAWASP